MATADNLELSALFERDEIAWLEAMSALAVGGRHAEMDYLHLGEYLANQTKRVRREVFNRLVSLLVQLKKGERPSEGDVWRGAVREQRRELRQLLKSPTLRKHAEVILPDAYAEAKRQTAGEVPQALSARGLEELLADADVSSSA